MQTAILKPSTVHQIAFFVLFVIGLAWIRARAREGTPFYFLLLHLRYLLQPARDLPCQRIGYIGHRWRLELGERFGSSQNGSQYHQFVGQIPHTSHDSVQSASTRML
jgi:hypothetical protein